MARTLDPVAHCRPTGRLHRCRAAADPGQGLRAGQHPGRPRPRSARRRAPSTTTSTPRPPCSKRSSNGWSRTRLARFSAESWPIRPCPRLRSSMRSSPTSPPCKAEHKDLLLGRHARSGSSDDNAIAARELPPGPGRAASTPLMTAIVRQGMREGIFTATSPDRRGRVLVSLFDGLNEDATDLFLALEGRTHLARRRPGLARRLHRSHSSGSSRPHAGHVPRSPTRRPSAMVRAEQSIHKGTSHDRRHPDREAHQVLRVAPRDRRHRPRGRGRRGLRLPRARTGPARPRRSGPCSTTSGRRAAAPASSGSRRPSTRSPSTAASATCPASSRSTTSSPAARRSTTSPTCGVASTGATSRPDRPARRRPVAAVSASTPRATSRRSG